MKPVYTIFYLDVEMPRKRNIYILENCGNLKMEIGFERECPLKLCMPKVFNESTFIWWKKI